MSRILMIIEILNNPIVKEFLSQILSWVREANNSQEPNSEIVKRKINPLKGGK